MIQIEKLNFKSFGIKEPSLIDINFTIEDGKFVLITGPSDCGKSTLIRTFNGLIPNFYGGKISGKVDVNGIDPFKTSTKDLCDTVGMIFQNPDNQLVMTSVEEEIIFGMENLGYPVELIHERLEMVLKTVNIEKLRNRSISTLSGGEKQKVAIASIIAMKPSILILDEPTSELDPISADEILDLLIELRMKENITIIVVEHRLEKLIPVADQWIIMNENRIIENGTPRSILSKRHQFFGINLPISFKNYIKWKDFIDGLSMPITTDETKKMISQINEYRKVKGEKQEDINSENEKQTSSSDDNIVIEVNSLFDGYKEGEYILKDINLKVRKGEFISIIGRNGSGKTTLLKVITGLKAFEKGSVKVNGKDVDPKSASKNARVTSMIFQNPSIQFYLDTVYDELVVGLKNFGLPIKKYSERIEHFLDYFNLRKYSQKYPRYLSVGTQQKLALASIMVWGLK